MSGELELATVLLLCVAALLAGGVDAVVGGGGLIQTPMLFSVLPNTAPATLLGTNKFAGVFGTGAAALSFARRAKLAWRVALPGAVAAFGLSFCGAYMVTHIPPDFMRRLLPLILVAVAVYTFWKKDFGQHHVPLHDGKKEKWLAALVGGSVGFYDGFFGPGTGSFLVFLFVRVFGYDFLSASAVSKVVNVACNVAALLWFGVSGHVLWMLGAMMALCNITGSIIGTRIAIRYGTAFVRRLFLGIVTLLIFKTSMDALTIG